MGAAQSSQQATGSHTSESDEKLTLRLAQSLGQVKLSAPESADGSLTLDNVGSWEDDVSSSGKAQLARTILAHSDISTTLLKRDAVVNDAHIFNHDIKFKTGPITSQKSSGRCWLFATTNVMRYNIMKRLNLDSFQLSQSYLFFWDKLNKANYYLELMIENADLPIDDRLIEHLSGGELLGDGGQWDMAVNIVERYGVVPQAIFPESTHSSLSGPLNALLKTKVREHGLILRRLSDSLRERSLSSEVITTTLRAEKEKLMKEVYTIMTATLGVPPMPDKAFVWEYYDKYGRFGRWEGTPKEFVEQFWSKPFPIADSFSLINDPRNEFSKLYTVDKLGNVWGGRPILYVNTEAEVMKNMVIRLIRAGMPVFFGCDVGKFSNRTEGIMDTNLMAYETAFDITLGLTKAERLLLQESAPNHAMVISAVHLDSDGKPVRYKVENSWGPDVGDKGYFVMTDKWFEEYVYQIVVPRAFAPRELVKVYEDGNPIVLPPWDVMGTLA